MDIMVIFVIKDMVNTMITHTSSLLGDYLLQYN